MVSGEGCESVGGVDAILRTLL
eukprot:COSAG02_NODE_17199_length_1022_cov_0.725894_1_plen_21_part_01